MTRVVRVLAFVLLAIPLTAAADTRLRHKVERAVAHDVTPNGHAAANGYAWTIEGEVVRPGVYAAGHVVRLDEALSMAGGTTLFARRDRIKLVRIDHATGRQEELTLDLAAPMASERLDLNVFLLPGDRIVVP